MSRAARRRTRAATCSASSCGRTATRSSGASSRTRPTRSRRRSRSSPRRPTLVLTTGGTGLAPRDVTPEATRTVLQREAPGIAEALRADSIAKTPHGLLSRGVAGVVGRTLVVNLPGSPGGCRDGYAVLRPALGHAVVAARRPGHRAHDRRRRRCRPPASTPGSSSSSTRSSRCRSPTSARSSPSAACRRRTTCSGSRSRWSALGRSRWR